MSDSNATELVRSEPFAWVLIDAAPDGIIVVEDGGRIVLVNRRAEELFGYARGELLSVSVEELVPEQLREAHVVHRMEYGADPHSRPMGENRRLQGRRRDGTTIPIEINLSPVYKNRSRIVIAAIRPAPKVAGRDHEVSAAKRRDAEVADRVLRRAHEIALLLRTTPGTSDPGPIVEKLDDIIRSITTTAFERTLEQMAWSKHTRREASGL